MSINVPTIDHEAELEDLRWEHYCNTAKKLDAGEIVNLIADKIVGETAETPLSALVEGWLESPEPDWERPVVSPFMAERLGKYVASIAAKIIEREIDRAVERSRDVPF
jgi:hypothetical protein